MSEKEGEGEHREMVQGELEEEWAGEVKEREISDVYLCFCIQKSQVYVHTVCF